MEVNHTPGPWSVHFADDSIDCNCKYVLSNISPICVATIHVRENDSIEHSEYPKPEEAKANAKLIADAPELLSKLKEALEAIEWYMHNTTPKNNDWNTFHDLGMNIRMSGEELTLKTE